MFSLMVPASLHSIQVLDPHHVCTLNSCDRFQRLSTCKFDSKFGCYLGAKARYQSVLLELVNLLKISNLRTSDYD